MKRIKEFLHRNRVSLMLVPQSNRSIRQIKFNLIAAFSVLSILILINAVFLIRYIYNQITADRLVNVNTELEISLQQEKDRIASLENIALHSRQQIETLKSKLAEATELVDDRLKVIEETEAQLASLIEIFNEQNDTEIPVPISRSFQRTPASSTAGSVVPVGTDAEATAQTVSDGATDASTTTVVEEANALLIRDEVSHILTEKAASLKELAKTLEGELNYLSARPDLYPAYGTFTSPFGYRTDPTYGGIAFHTGVDIANDVGTPIYAAGDGVVVFADYQGSFGYLMLIDHGYGYVTAYAHCDDFVAEVGQVVSKGDVIAHIGMTGRVTGPHLHFEIRYQGTPIDPLTILK